MPSTIVDTGPLVAIFDAGDNHHRAAVAWVKRANKPLITNVPVITEVTHLLSFSVDAQLAFLGWAQSNLHIDVDTSGDLTRIVGIMKKYRDQPADFADASLLALAERSKINRVASTDGDFNVYRTLAGRALRNVFYENI